MWIHIFDNTSRFRPTNKTYIACVTSDVSPILSTVCVPFMLSRARDVVERNLFFLTEKLYTVGVGGILVNM